MHRLMLVIVCGYNCTYVRTYKCTCDGKTIPTEWRSRIEASKTGKTEHIMYSYVCHVHILFLKIRSAFTGSSCVVRNNRAKGDREILIRRGRKAVCISSK